MTTTTVTASDVTALLTSDTTLDKVKTNLLQEGFAFPGGDERLRSNIVKAVTSAEGNPYFFDAISEHVFSVFSTYTLGEWIHENESIPKACSGFIDFYTHTMMDSSEATRRAFTYMAGSVVLEVLEDMVEDTFGQDAPV